MAEEKLQILSLAGTNTLVIRKSSDSRLFITTPDSIIIGLDGLAFLVNYIVKHEILSPVVLMGILEEYNTN